MRTCVNFGTNCVHCGYGHCIDERRCIGMCYTCNDEGCDNHPQNKAAELYCYADELLSFA